MLRTLIVSLCITSVAAAADRPTAEQVKKAVEESRAAYVEKHTPTLKGLETDLAKLQKELRGEIRQRPRDGEKLKDLNTQIKALQQKVALAKRGKFDAVEPQLMPLNFGELTVGAVGRLERMSIGKGAEIIVDQILERDRFLGHLRSYQNVAFREGRTIRIRAQAFESESVLFVGFKKAGEVQEGSAFEIECDAVVTGQYSFADVEGAKRTVPILEPFDSSKAFK
jgi:hypothetical protein